MRHIKHNRMFYASELYHILWIMPQEWITTCCGFTKLIAEILVRQRNVNAANDHYITKYETFM